MDFPFVSGTKIAINMVITKEKPAKINTMPEIPRDSERIGNNWKRDKNN